jgi:hypothetical protein
MIELRWRAFRRVPWIWSGWEWIYMRTHPTTAVRPGSLFAFRSKGQILELHIDGRALARMREKPGYSGFKAVHELREDLRVLASRVASGELGPVIGLKGTSLMGEAGGVFGFESQPLPRNFANVLKQYFLVGLDAIYHPRGLRERSKRRWPIESWMSASELLRRYGEKSPRSTVAR